MSSWYVCPSPRPARCGRVRRAKPDSLAFGWLGMYLWLPLSSPFGWRGELTNKEESPTAGLCATGIQDTILKGTNGGRTLGGPSMR
jgi:hypothetical protein